MRRVVGRGPGVSALRIAALLPPAILRFGQAVMAGKTIQLGILRPLRALHMSRQPLHGVAQLRRLPNAPGARPEVRFRGQLPVRRHDGGVRIQLKHQIGMSRGDHLVVHFFFCRAQMAVQTIFRAPRQRAQVQHAELERLLVRPALYRMRTQPG